ncbi:MAG: hypothetical protein ACRDSF_16720, partial [Pseudonocardiaceae bacterium]
MAAAEPASRRASVSNSAASDSAASKSGAAKTPSSRNGAASDADLASVASSNRAKGTRSGVAQARPKARKSTAKAVTNPADVADTVVIEAE